jgi:hypothetical protein
MGIKMRIDQFPNEMPEHIRFSEDRAHPAYDPQHAHRFWQILVQTDRVFKLFRTSFLGKCSPVHFFWGSFDLAVTRFSGQRAPLYPGGVLHLADAVARQAYSHEVISAGFWPGGGPIAYPAFYCYAYPEPASFPTTAVTPDAAFYNLEMREFILPYDAVRTAASPDETLLAFLQSAYEAAADAGAWDRTAFESEIGKAGVVRAIACLQKNRLGCDKVFACRHDDMFPLHVTGPILPHELCVFMAVFGCRRSSKGKQPT